jgi:alpha-1,3-glucan synthase
MAEPIFWIALICQLIVVMGYFFFYRKEQLGMSHAELLNKPMLTTS